MRWRGLALALAAASLLSCADQSQKSEVGGGGGEAARDFGVVRESRERPAVPPPAPTATPAADSSRPLELGWGTSLEGDRRLYAELYARAVWVQTNLAVEEWAQAKADQSVLQDRLNDLRTSTELPPPIRDAVNSLAPRVASLGEQIEARDARAKRTASRLVETLTQNTDMFVSLGWLAPGGGGAGR